MKQIKFTEDYRFAELPQHGGEIIDAKEGDVHTVSYEIAELCKKAGKAVDYESERFEENPNGNGEGSGQGGSGGPDENPDENLDENPDDDEQNPDEE